MSDQGQFFWEAHLTQGEWANIPADLARWYEHNYSHQSRLRRQSIINEAIPIVNKIISTELTPRQRQVVLLYFGEQNTEVEIARKLRISQPTVSQHLNGKKRGGKKVGGAMRRIRKYIRRQAKRSTRTDGLAILLILDALLDKNATRRRAAELFRGFQGGA